MPMTPFVQVNPNAVVRDRQTGALRLLNGSSNMGGLFAVTVDWCHFCQDLKRNIALAKRIRPFPFYNLDATNSDKNPVLAAKLKELDIDAFPRIFKIGFGGQLVEYTGGNRTPEMLAYLATPSSSAAMKSYAPSRFYY